jgi:hypothetical protein
MQTAETSLFLAVSNYAEAKKEKREVKTEGNANVRLQRHVCAFVKQAERSNSTLSFS